MIVDLKSGARERWHELQTAGYDHLSADHRLHFDPDTHTYSFVSYAHPTAIVPGVTQILSETGAIKNNYRDDFPRNRGTAIHQAIALLAFERLDWASVDGVILPYLISWQEWQIKSDFIVTGAEVKGYNSDLGYAGTRDLIGNFPGENPYTRGCVYLQADGSIAKLVEHTDPNDWPMFVSFLNVWKWNQKNGRRQ